MKGVESWSELSKNRTIVSRRLGTIWDIPIVKKQKIRLLANISNDSHVLDVGAAQRRYGDVLLEHFPNLYYKSMDIDPNTKQDYYDLDDIDEKFDFIFMFEVIEHLELAEGLALLKKLRSKLKSGGKILLSTPNLFHPHQYFGDSTHVTFYKFDELGGLMMMAGFSDISAFRVHKGPFVQRMIRIYLGVYLHKYLDLDFAKTVLLEGLNP